MRILIFTIGLLCTTLSDAAGLLVIASPQVPVEKISIHQLADIYALKKTQWSNQAAVVPVNRESSSEERDLFSEAVFKMSSQELAELWNTLRFEGKNPPLTQISNHAVVGFVRSVPGAIGYISGGEEVPTGVKVLLRLP
jgi:ABC-type phosphate transport system substrate-binding protein